MRNSNMSRRNLLKGMGAGALGFGLVNLGVTSTEAQIGPTSADLTGYFRFSLGDFSMTVISDRTAALPAAFLGGNQPEEEMQAYFANLRLLDEESGTIPNTFLNLVLQNGDQTVVFDTGNGAGAGKLVATLDALGIGADAINTVIISHWHPDHINGLSTDGVLTFPNAEVHFPQPEYDFMMSAPADMVGGAMAKLQPALDADAVSFFNDGDEVVPGVTAIHSPGHTPGHMAFYVESNGSGLMHFVDAVINVYATYPNPEWYFGFDADPDLAVESRKSLLARAAEEGVTVMGYHHPFPGVGYAIDEGDESYRFIPAAF